MPKHRLSLAAEDNLDMSGIELLLIVLVPWSDMGCVLYSRVGGVMKIDINALREHLFCFSL